MKWDDVAVVLMSLQLFGVQKELFIFLLIRHGASVPSG